MISFEDAREKINTYILKDRKTNEIVKIKDCGNNYMFLVQSFNEYGYLESYIPQPIYCLNKSDGRIDKFMLGIDREKSIIWENAKLVYIRRAALKEIKNELSHSEYYKNYNIHKIYVSKDYYKFHIRNELFKIDNLIIYSLKDNCFLEYTDEIKNKLKGIYFEEVKNDK